MDFDIEDKHFEYTVNLTGPPPHHDQILSFMLSSLLSAGSDLMNLLGDDVFLH